jgi:ABC-type antimicrobial peptide transport system permease subunit
VTHGFFEVFGVPVLEGRDFRRGDMEPAAERVVVVNRSFADRFLDGQGVGRLVRRRSDDDAPWMRVIGVVADIHEGVAPMSDQEAIAEAVYVPLSANDLSFMSLAVRTAGPVSAVTPALRRVVSAVDPNLPLYFVEPMQDVLDGRMFMHRIFGTMFTIFGGAALFLAAVGLYGVIDFSVSARVREMGIRIAMGAERSHVLRLVLGTVAMQLALGIGLGLAIGAGLSVPLSSIFVGVRTWDALVYGVIVGTLALTGIMAALAPSLRAVRVDPVVALRA